MEKPGSRPPTPTTTPTSSPRTIETSPGTPPMGEEAEQTGNSAKLTTRISKGRSTPLQKKPRQTFLRPAPIKEGDKEGDAKPGWLQKRVKPSSTKPPTFALAGERVASRTESDAEVPEEDLGPKADIPVSESPENKFGRKPRTSARSKVVLALRSRENPAVDSVEMAFVPLPNSINKPVLERLEGAATAAKKAIESKSDKKLSKQQRYINAIYFALGGPAKEDLPECRLEDVRSVMELEQHPSQDKARLLFAEKLLQQMHPIALDPSAEFLFKLALQGGVSAMRQWCEAQLRIEPQSSTPRSWFAEVQDFYTMCTLRDDEDSKRQYSFKAVGMDNSTREKFNAVIESTVKEVLSKEPGASKEVILLDIKLAIAKSFGLELDGKYAEKPYWQVSCLAAVGMDKLSGELQRIFSSGQPEGTIDKLVQDLLRDAKYTTAADHEISRLLDRTPESALQLWSAAPLRVLEAACDEFKIKPEETEKVRSLLANGEFMTRLSNTVEKEALAIFNPENVAALPDSFCNAFGRVNRTIEQRIGNQHQEHKETALGFRERETAFNSFGKLWNQNQLKYEGGTDNAHKILLQKINKEFADFIKQPDKARNCGYEDFVKAIRKRAAAEEL